MYSRHEKKASAGTLAFVATLTGRQSPNAVTVTHQFKSTVPVHLESSLLAIKGEQHGDRGQSSSEGRFGGTV